MSQVSSKIGLHPPASLCKPEKFTHRRHDCVCSSSRPEPYRLAIISTSLNSYRFFCQATQEARQVIDHN